MFTGIIEELGKVVAIEQQPDAIRLTIEGPKVVSDVHRGDSISVCGTCLTAVEFDDRTFTADVMHETLRLTSLSEVQVGDVVNLERAMTAATRFGGHVVQGHVDGVGQIISREPSENWEWVRVRIPRELMKYVVLKGSITIDGVSLTVNEVGEDHIGLSRDRLLTEDEMIDYMAAQIKLGAKLGFPVARCQISMTPDVMEKLLPTAEKYNVKLGIEVHSHHSPRHQEMQEHLERYEKLNSGYLGFVPDFGATTVGMPPSLIEKYRKTGVPEDMISELLELWQVHHAEGAPKDGRTQGMRMGQVAGIAAKYGYGETAIDYAINHCGLFGHADPSEWADIMHLVWHTHAKFFGMHDGDEPTTPLPAILKNYADAGYTGSMSSEYEGYHWDDWSNPFDQVDAHQKRIREIMAGYGYEVRTTA